MTKTILLPAHSHIPDSSAHEEDPIQQLGPDAYQLLASPGPVLGVAAGDTIRFPARGGFEIVTRGRCRAFP